MEVFGTIDIRDRRTFDFIFDSFYPVLVYHANKFLGEHAQFAEDIVQDVFVKILEQAKVFDREAEIRAYLYTAVKNHCLNFQKSKKVRQLYAEQFRSTALPVTAEKDQALQEETYRQLRLALAQLPERCRQIFQLTIQGYRIAEIAEHMQISEETVKSQKKRGKELLRKNLKHLNGPVHFLLTLWLLQ